MHLLTSNRDESDGVEACWRGPVSEMPEYCTAALLTQDPARPLRGLEYVIDARALSPEETARAAASVACPYAPLLRRRGRNAFFPRLRRLDSEIAALAESGLEAAAVELGPVEDPAEVLSTSFAGLKLLSPAAPRGEILTQAVQTAFRPRTRAARLALEGLFERAEDALGGRDGIDALDAGGLSRYIGGMKPLSALPGKVARECAEGERVRAIAKHAAKALEAAKSMLRAGGRACGRGGAG